MQATSRDFKANAHRALGDSNLQRAMGMMRTGFPKNRAQAIARLPEFDALRPRGVAALELGRLQMDAQHAYAPAADAFRTLRVLPHGHVEAILMTIRRLGLDSLIATQPSRSRDLVTAMFAALGRAPDIRYIDMPDAIRDKYQYFTQSSVENLRRAGYNAGFTPLAEAVKRYVVSYLDTPDRYR